MENGHGLLVDGCCSASCGTVECDMTVTKLAAVHERVDLVRRGFRLYEAFRPDVPAGESGWGAKGELDLDAVRAMAAKAGG